MKFAAIAGAMALAAGANAATTVYTDQASFLANVASGYYFNDFTGIPTGLNPAMNFGPVNGYSYTIDSETPGNLYNDPGIISTNFAGDAIIITFTGGNVTAVGGNMWGTDINVFPIPANMDITLSDGTVHSYSSNSATAFAGFVSDSAITSISLQASDPLGGNVWSTLDNLYVGSAIPTPGALALFGVAGLAAARRRR